MVVFQALLLLTLAAPPTDVVVRREGVRVLRAPKAFAPPCEVAAPRPGQTLKLLERQGTWARVAAPGGGKCWIQETAWEDREVGALNQGGVDADEEDVALAARGFSEAMVNQYKVDHPDLQGAFTVLDDYLRGPAEPREVDLRRFLLDGKLQDAAALAPAPQAGPPAVKAAKKPKSAAAPAAAGEVKP